MKTRYAANLILFGALLLSTVYAQCPQQVTLSLTKEIPFTFPNQALTMKHDRNNKPYLYVAAKEQGIRIYDLAPVSPVLVKSFPVSVLSNLEAMSVSQDGNYLYVALGNSFGTAGQLPGMAIIDVSDPANAVLKDSWKFSTGNTGAGIVQVEGDYAYLGAMGQGLIILNIADKTNITFVSQFIPSISFPNPVNPDPAKYNARGLEVKNSVVYLCYDAGGFRIIDATNKNLPKETGHYSNSLLQNRPRAYNNLVLNDSLAYIAVDYCGMEILNIKDSTHITQTGWWNPWHCENTSNTWFNSGGHTNEIVFHPYCKLIFMSSGKSEVSVVNVSDPTQPDSCTKYTTPAGSQGTWGIDLYNSSLYTGYIFVPLGIPFSSNWGGVKIIDFHSNCIEGVSPIASRPDYRLVPNPAGNEVKLTGTQAGEKVSFTFFDMTGKIILTTTSVTSENTINISALPAACYQVLIKGKYGEVRKKLIVTNNY